MKKLIISLALCVFLFSYCADKKTIDGKTYRPYGLFNETRYKNDSIQYEVSGWAVFSGIIFIELIVPPIYTFGYNLWQPIGKKSDFSEKSSNKGVVN